jgi:hypothetical protein
MRDPNPHPFFFSGRASATFALALAALLAGCAGNQHSHQATKSEYYRDAQLCRDQNPIKPKPRSNIAGNLSAEIVAGVDTDGYLQCMARLGWKQDPKTDPLLKALDKCRKQAGHPATATAEPGGTQIGSGLDRAAFRECLKQRDFGEVTVEPLQTVPAK